MAQETKENNPAAAASNVNLKDRNVAALLTLVFPGLGHVYQGRLAKALLFALCVGGLFFYGAWLGSSAKYGPCRVVYYCMEKQQERYYFFAQMWVGLPASPAIVQYLLDKTGEEPILWGLMAPPAQAKYERRRVQGEDMSVEIYDPQRATEANIREYLNRRFELGTIFTVVAGLLNIFVLLDAYAGPVPELEEEGENKNKNKDTPKPGASLMPEKTGAETGK